MSKKMVVFYIIVIVIIAGLIVYKKNKNVDLSKTVVIEQKYSEKLAGGERINTSTKLKKEKVFKGLKFTNINLVKQEGNTMLLADVENNSGKDLSSKQKIIVVFKDSTGKEVGQVEGLLPAIKNGTKKQLNSNILTASDDIINAYDFEIKEAK